MSKNNKSVKSDCPKCFSACWCARRLGLHHRELYSFRHPRQWLIKGKGGTKSSRTAGRKGIQEERSKGGVSEWTKGKIKDGQNKK